MKFTPSWLKQHLDTDEPLDALAGKLPCERPQHQFREAPGRFANFALRRFGIEQASEEATEAVGVGDLDVGAMDARRVKVEEEVRRDDKHLAGDELGWDGGSAPGSPGK